jgi:hypothetical protein
MILPQPLEPVWNLQWYRRVTLLFFLVVATIDVLCLLTGRFTCAGAFAISVIIFGGNYHVARHVTLRMERWAARPGFRRMSVY